MGDSDDRIVEMIIVEATNLDFILFLTMIVVKYWNRLPRNLVVSPLLEVFKTRPSPKEPPF